MNTRPAFQRSVFVVCCILTIGIGMLHYIVPKDISMFILYLGPIILAAHLLSTLGSYTITILATVAWTLSYLYSEQPQVIGVSIWNILVRVGLFFSATVYSHLLIARIRSEESARQEILQMKQQEKPLSGSRLNCEECGKINTADNQWLAPLDFLRSEAQLELYSCICPTCLERVHAKDRRAP